MHTCAPEDKMKKKHKRNRDTENISGALIAEKLKQEKLSRKGTCGNGRRRH